MSSFGAGYGLGIEQLQPDREREAHDRHADDPAPAARQEPAVREDERNGERPGEQDRRHGRRLGLVRPGRTDELLRGDLEGRQERSEQEDPGDAVARKLEGDQEADDGRGQDREREERIDRERNPVLLVGGNDLQDLQQADRQRSERRERDAAGEDAKTAHPDIIRLDVPRRNRCQHRDRAQAGRTREPRYEEGERRIRPRSCPAFRKRPPTPFGMRNMSRMRTTPYAIAGPPGFWVSSTIRSGRREPRSCPCAQNGMK